MKSTIIILALVVCGCAASTDRRMKSWLGADGSELLSAWGAPNSAMELGDGGKVLTWERFWTYTGPRFRWVARHRHGRQSFTIDSSGKVVGYSSHDMPSSGGGPARSPTDQH